jgi:hypothetical protein
VIVWRDFKIDPKHAQYTNRVILHSEFMKAEVTDEHRKELDRRMSVQRPGNAISYV